MPQLNGTAAMPGPPKASNASSLPQGVLAPLPRDEIDTVPAKAYPTVLQQHLNNVRKFNDCVVLTRVGDFYEMYFDQVKQYAPLVNLKVAKRATVLGDVPMAGFQHTQLDRYLKMFVQDLGKQVAISEQVRLPDSERSSKAGAPMYDRKVTRVVTAGTLIDESFMDPYENNYLLAVHLEGALPAHSAHDGRSEAYERYKRTTKVGLSWVDLSSGDFYTQSSDLASLPSLAARVGPREVVLDSTMESAGQAQLQKLLGEGGYSLHYHQTTQTASSVAEWTPMLERAVPDKDQDNFTAPEIAAGSLVLDYIRNKLIDQQIQLQPPVRRSDDEYMSIDKQSLRGLEIRSTLRDGTFQGSVLHAVRHTVTKSGARLLSQRLVSPSMSLSVINNRLDLVQEMVGQDAFCEDVVALLRRTSDTLRLLQRFSIGKGDADDLLSLAKTVDVMGRLSEVLHDHIVAHQDGVVEQEEDVDLEPPELGFLWDILGRLDLQGPARVSKSIQHAIDEDGLDRRHVAEAEDQAEAEEMTDEVVSADTAGEKGPRLAKRASKTKVTTAESGPEEIWVMRRNASPTLERAHADLEKLLDLKRELARRLREQLKAESLMLKWGAQLGHYCHIKGRDAQGILSALEGARSIGSTKSTRTFYLADWTHLGVRIDDSKLRIRTEEERVFGKLRGQVVENLMKLRRNAAVLDELDVACSSATIAKERNLVRPILSEDTSHRIVGGRHPTVDAGLKAQGRVFTANDCAVGDQEKIYLITGPNMAGKSTYLRQNALITILAQTGCFVPADYAVIGLVDKIFSRVGSADNLYQDQSTFMVEMLEAAEILKQATPRSFVIMDEVGRGTTPEDGVAVGYACLHHLHHINKSRTLFATHFHALADMTRDFDALACYCTDVAEAGDGSWAYVHKLRRGVNRESHALKVARLAGLPESAMAVAAEVLADLQKERRRSAGHHSASLTALEYGPVLAVAAG
ncbi:hypothetical protein LTR36_003214 [Oleoguttula mirabilis]|uniref:DNA mismatch repair proteins mutS family domain-containing protein n=1 Tax=Oleoguttula mirabilis TaxID=1507867 RepID=A0AAV9JWW8_9PEZI|nr:hypothetical protein LTR36_003214 [Oleoguttula mirabilis]